MTKIICVVASLFLGPFAFAKGASLEKGKQKIIKVEISEKGFHPSKILAKKGEDLVLLITRKTDKTCMKELKTIDGTGEVQLPLNQEVEFKVGKLDEAGEVRLLCGMSMTAGVVSVI